MLKFEPIKFSEYHIVGRVELYENGQCVYSGNFIVYIESNEVGFSVCESIRIASKASVIVEAINKKKLSLFLIKIN